MTGDSKGAVGIRGATALSHLFLRDQVRPGDRVVDATCGNGRDTLLLAELVGPHGKVWGFDIQKQALDTTSTLLTEAGVRDRVELVHCGHEQLTELVTPPISALVFNLGYLPGGDKKCVTRSRETLTALTQGAELLGTGGRICIVLYTGHSGGMEEADNIEAWSSGLAPQEYHVWRCRQMNRSAAAPYLLLIEKAC